MIVARPFLTRNLIINQQYERDTTTAFSKISQENLKFEAIDGTCIS